MNSELQLYYHIPFCVSKCAYCSFFSKPCCSDTVMSEYTAALIRQTKAFPAEGYKISTIYFGGGTPTVLGAKRLFSVLEAVLERFDVAENAEITFEANPKTVSFSDLCVLKAAGFNRVSLGAQSFNNETLRLLGRAHTAEDFTDCYRKVRMAGFDNVSTDLIFALPNESTGKLLHSVKTLVSLEPEHISVYGLSVEEGTPLWRQKESLSFPAEDEEERQYDSLCRILADGGYEHYEISNFSKPGYAARHNVGYWKRVPYFGFGAGAHSFYENRRFCTENDIAAYIENSNSGFLAPTDFYCAQPLSPTEAEEERIMLGLRLAEGVQLEANVPPYITEGGFATYENGRLALTEKGFRVSNAIISKFI